MTTDYDVIIIGSGPAGFSCAIQATKFDKKVLIVEKKTDNLGGSWINTGTVPSKSLREAAKLIQKFHTQFGDEKGRKPFERFRMEDLLQYKRTILENKNRKVKDDIIKNEIDTVRGFGKVISPNEVEVRDQNGVKKKYTSSFILVATGSTPLPPENFKLDGKRILDYHSILDMTHIPRRLTIVGSGIIALEYATIFAALGTRVAMLSDQKELLPFLDLEVRNMLMDILTRKTIRFIPEVNIRNVRKNPLRTCNEVEFKTENEDRVQVIETDYVLYVGGKTPNTSQMGALEQNLKMDDDGYLIINQNYQTSVPTIYAAGDVTGPPSQASISFNQGRMVACDMFDSVPNETLEFSPYGIYSIPEISGIGLTEQEAKDKGLDVSVGRAYFSSLTRADLSHEENGILKLVFETQTLKLAGVHILGDQASDLVHLGQSIMAKNGNIKYFIETVLNYPTYAEAYRIAAFNGINRVYKAGVKYKKILENQ